MNAPQSSRGGMFRNVLPWLWIVGAGALQAISLAWPGNGQALGWLQVVSLAVLVAQLPADGRPLRAALLGWAFATTWLVGTFWWLYISMHVYGGLASPLAMGAVAALAAFLGCYYAIACAVFARLRLVRLRDKAFVFAALWTLAEIARGTLWTGFPWGASGYAHVDSILSALPRWVGVYGTGAIAATLAVFLTGWRLWPDAKVIGRVIVVVAVLGGLQWHRQLLLMPSDQDRAPFSLALLQGNIPQDEKFEQGSGIPQALRWYGNALQAADADLVVAPETAIPLLPSQLMPGYLEAVSSPYLHSQQRKSSDVGDGTATVALPRAALVGIPLGSLREGYTNSVYGWQADVPVYRYNKHHLVPFGEFIPPMFRWFTEMMNIPLGDFARGALVQPSMAWRDERIAPNICYEDLFGEEIGARFAQADTAPTVLVNFSNIGWFGDTVAVDQHLHISRMRSLEFERPMVRATNTGATAVIDYTGEVTHRLPNFTEGVLRAEVQGRSGTVTPYAWWVSRTGLWPLVVLCLSVVLAAAWQSRLRHSAVAS